MDTLIVGKKIKELRELKNLKQKEIGSILGFSESYISLVEKGVRFLSIKSLQKLIDELGLRNDFFSEAFTAAHFRADINNDNEAQNKKIADDFFEYAKSRIKNKC